MKSYEAFICVAERGSFIQAAREMNYSQSMVSRMISGLEEEWGVLLLERSRAGVCLTADGEVLLASARALVAAQADFAARVDDIKGVRTGHVRIGAFSSAATHWLPKIIGRFRQDYPGITYEVLLGDYEEIEHWVACGRVDCGFTRLPAAPGLAVLPLGKDELMAVLPPEHALAKLERVPAALLREESFLLLEKDANTVVDEVFETCGGTPRSAFTTWDDYAIMSMVENGLGVSVLPELILRRIPYRVVVRSLAEPVYRKIGLVTKAASVPSAAVARFLDYLDCRNDDEPDDHRGEAGR